MFLEERYEKIIKTIENEGRETIKDLAKQFEVTKTALEK